MRVVRLWALEGMSWMGWVCLSRSGSLILGLISGGPLTGSGLRMGCLDSIDLLSSLIGKVYGHWHGRRNIHSQLSSAISQFSHPSEVYRPSLASTLHPSAPLADLTSNPVSPLNVLTGLKSHLSEDSLKRFDEVFVPGEHTIYRREAPPTMEWGMVDSTVYNPA